MSENKITLHWSFDSQIIWIKELAEIVKMTVKNAPDIIIETIGSELLFKYLFLFCFDNKANLLNLKHAKDFDEMMNRAFSNQSIRDAGKDEHYSNNYELDKILTKKYLKSELESLRIKCENKSFKSEIKTIKNDYTYINRELEIAHNKLKNRAKNRAKVIRQKIETEKARVEFFEKAINDFEPKLKNTVEKCRFKNGKINFSKLGKQFGVDHKTALNWCKRYAIKLHLT
jgi:hypothetical protein